ncbi:TRAP transporter substrate-binding protein [Elioraea thermophila]|uniref:TRAP transporter substrate-binding protein n=1 Tax=Elioraea thermophila TaxID=2185104 RepID=UPI000DF25F19|nr:TRAP transporter substrate-binding protein [Elioraea thermophila]
MKRRSLIAAGAGAAAAAATFPTPAISQGRIQWRMVTSWPRGFPGLGVGAERIARRIGEMSGGRLTVQVFAAGQLVPALGVFDAVTQGGAEMMHSAAYYWQNRNRGLAFFTGVPMGMTSKELRAWVRFMGGQQLWDEIYAQFNLKGFLSGDTGVQAGGWFRRELNSLADVRGLKFRTPGIGGECWRRIGAAVVNLGAPEILPNLQSGALDAAEFVGPATDLALGLHQAARFYYWPSVIEPGLATELTVDKRKFDALPADLKRIIEVAAQADYDEVPADLDAQNIVALRRLTTEFGVQIRTFPDEIMIALGNAAGEVLRELRDGGDPLTRRVVDSFVAARTALMEQAKLTDDAFARARALPYTYL